MKKKKWKIVNDYYNSKYILEDFYKEQRKESGVEGLELSDLIDKIVREYIGILETNNSMKETIKKIRQEVENKVKNYMTDIYKSKHYELVFHNGSHELFPVVEYYLTPHGNFIKAMEDLPIGRTLILPDNNKVTKINSKQYIFNNLLIDF